MPVLFPEDAGFLGVENSIYAGRAFLDVHALPTFS
jgi:hypothetical protein